MDRHRLEVVADLLCEDLIDVLDVRVLDAELVSVVGADLEFFFGPVRLDEETFLLCISENLVIDKRRQRERERDRNTYDAHARPVDGDDVLDSGVALGLVEAVAARLVEGAERVRVEARDVVLAAERVILEDLILCMSLGSAMGKALRSTRRERANYLIGRFKSAAADDTELRVEALRRQSVFADVFPPHWRAK